VVSLLAGTPAILITHDTRTQELALAMNIPHSHMSEIDTSRDLSIGEMYKADQMSAFAGGYKAYRGNFERFFMRNGLRLVDEKASLGQRLISSVRFLLGSIRYRLDRRI
jgi:hypothetical protein